MGIKFCYKLVCRNFLQTARWHHYKLDKCPGHMTNLSPLTEPLTPLISHFSLFSLCSPLEIHAKLFVPSPLPLSLFQSPQPRPLSSIPLHGVEMGFAVPNFFSRGALEYAKVWLWQIWSSNEVVRAQVWSVLLYHNRCFSCGSWIFIAQLGLSRMMMVLGELASDDWAFKREIAAGFCWLFESWFGGGINDGFCYGSITWMYWAVSPWQGFGVVKMGLVVAPHFVQSWSSGMVLIGFVVADLFQNRAHIRKKKKWCGMFHWVHRLLLASEWGGTAERAKGSGGGRRREKSGLWDW